MNQPSSLFAVNDAIGNREDLSDKIWDISPLDTPVLSSIEKTSAMAIKHEWQTDVLAAAAANTNVEGDDANVNAVVPTVRPFNYTQILDKVNFISGTQEVVEKAGRGSEVDYQKARRLQEMKRDLEYTLCAITTVPTLGDDSNPRIMGGLLAWIATNDVHVGTSPVYTNGTPTTARVDGTVRAFTEAQFKSALALQYAQGGEVNMAVMGPFNKQVFSTFSGNTTRFDSAEDARLVATVDVYRSDFGTIKIIPSRFTREAAGSRGDVLILDPKLLALAELRPAFSYDLAKAGDSLKYQLIHECTLEVRNEKGLASVNDLTVS